MAKKRILVYVPGSGEDGCAWYRGVGPWSHLGKDFADEVEVRFAYSKAQCGDIRMADCLFMLRPYTAEEVMMARMAKRLGVPVWTDWDDFLFGLTPDNPAKPLYDDPNVTRNMTEVLSLSSVVTVTTKALESAMDVLAVERCVLVPNSYDPYFDKVRQPIKRSKSTQILYRGSVTHQRDLSLANKVFLTAESKQACWFFVGLQPWEFDRMKNATFVPGRGAFDYFEVLGALSVDIGIVPLAPTQFNLCKSNIAAMEIALAGGVALVPNWAEWRDIPGVAFYSQNQSFEDEFHNLLALRQEYPSAVAKRAADTIEYFKTERHLGKANATRMEIIRSL